MYLEKKKKSKQADQIYVDLKINLWIYEWVITAVTSFKYPQ